MELFILALLLGWLAICVVLAINATFMQHRHAQRVSRAAGQSLPAHPVPARASAQIERRAA